AVRPRPRAALLAPPPPSPPPQPPRCRATYGPKPRPPPPKTRRAPGPARSPQKPRSLDRSVWCDGRHSRGTRADVNRGRRPDVGIRRLGEVRQVPCRAATAALPTVAAEPELATAVEGNDAVAPGDGHVRDPAGRARMALLGSRRARRAARQHLQHASRGAPRRRPVAVTFGIAARP